jgi:hypothetical protein
MRTRRRTLQGTVIVTILMIPLVFASMGGCRPDWCATFTAASSSAVQSGIISILTGIVNGIYAVALPDNDSSSATTSTTTSGTTTTYHQGSTDANNP